MPSLESTMSTADIRELEQLYDLVVSDIEANPAITWDEIISLYPVGKLLDALRHAHMFGAEDSARHHFIEWNNKRYLKQEWDDMQVHQEVQDMFTEREYYNLQPCAIAREDVPW